MDGNFHRMNEWLKIYEWRLTISTQNNVCSQRQVPPQTNNTITLRQYNPQTLTPKTQSGNIGLHNVTYILHKKLGENRTYIITILQMRTHTGRSTNPSQFSEELLFVPFDCFPQDKSHPSISDTFQGSGNWSESLLYKKGRQRAKRWLSTCRGHYQVSGTVVVVHVRFMVRVRVWIWVMSRSNLLPVFKRGNHSQENVIHYARSPPSTESNRRTSQRAVIQQAFTSGLHIRPSHQGSMHNTLRLWKNKTKTKVFPHWPLVAAS